MKKMFLVCFLVGALLLPACNFTKQRHSDPFYSSTGEWDAIRLPLIKPYEAVNIDNNKGWSISLRVLSGTPMLSGSVEDVQKIAVEDDAILVYTPSVPDFEQDVLSQLEIYHWYVIIPDRKIQKGFYDEEEFLTFIEDNHIADVTWQTPDDLFQKFKKTGCLKWIPDCD